MKILLAFDDDMDFPGNVFFDFLRNKTKSLEFSLFDTPIEFTDDYVRFPKSNVQLMERYRDFSSDFDKILIFTERPYDDNYFFHQFKNTAIISFFAWSQLTTLPLENGVLYFIADIIALHIDPTSVRHNDVTGCIYDFLELKTGVDDGMRQARICPNCLERLDTHLKTEDHIIALEDLKTIMNSLSNSSKWNQNVLSVPDVISTEIGKRETKNDGEIHVVIASPGDTNQEREILLNSLEIKFRKNNHEEHCKHRLIVHGWEDLASQPGYTQDVINQKIISKMDFVVAVFKHKLGIPTIDQSTGRMRAQSGTAEELLLALDNSEIDHPLGMTYFYSKAPVISLDSSDLDKVKSNWDSVNNFKNDIKDRVIFKPYTDEKDLLINVLMDLEKNIIDNFVDE